MRASTQGLHESGIRSKQSGPVGNFLSYRVSPLSSPKCFDYFGFGDRKGVPPWPMKAVSAVKSLLK